jgi:CRP-like cAMP-binding protein
MSWNDLLGNVSYLLIACSYLVTNMLWLRVLAIIGLATESLYFCVVGTGSLWVAIGWSVVFLVINASQLARLLREMRATRLSDDERFLKEGTLASLSLLSFRRLMDAGQWQLGTAGQALTVQQADVTQLRVLTHGLAQVQVDGRTVAHIHPGGIVGEMSLLTGEPASATVTLSTDARYFQIDGAALKGLLAEHEDLQAQFHRALGNELSAKVLALRGGALAGGPPQ